VLRDAGVDEPLSEEDEFIAACARGDERRARAIQSRTPNIVDRLTTPQLQMLPELAATGDLAAVRTMLALGWPIDVKLDWDATALNQAVFRGDARMAGLLLANVADWRARHAYGDNVIGTLSFASQFEQMEPPAPLDYAGCARALLAHGVPAPSEEDYGFSEEVSAVFDAWRSAGTDAAP
jgi:hypothetical protein